MAIKKDIIKDALTEAKKIEQFAFESAKKALEESLAPQIEEVVLNSLRELEKDSSEEKDLNENISKTVSEQEIDESNIEENNSQINSEEIMTHEENEDIFEVEGVEDAQPAQPEAAPAPAPEETQPSMEDIETKLADMAQKIDTILSAVNAESAEGQVDVIDDEAGQSASPENPEVSAQAPVEAPAPSEQPKDNSVVSEEDTMFEIDEEFMKALSEMNLENSEESMDLSEMDDLDEIEIVSEEDRDAEDEEEDTVDEMRGLGNPVKRSAANRKDFEEKKKFKHAPVAMNEGIEKIKAHYESKIDELIKENSSLKQAVEEYKSNIQEFNDSFVELQKQINEMHVFNGKLAYANRLLSKGGLTNSEKVMIAEAFDKAETVEEAKKIYTQFLKQMKLKTEGTMQTKEIKTAKPSVAVHQTPTQSKTIFESEESKRMKKLAGIIKEENL